MRKCDGCENPKDDRRWMSIDGTSLCEECVDAGKTQTDILKCEVDKLTAELDDYREQLQAQAMQIEGMLEQVRAETAKRAVEVCEEHYRLWLKEESKWGERDFLSVGAETIIDALRAEFNLGE